MDASQRAMVAAKMANILHGQVGGGHEKQKCKSATLITQPEAAKLMNVSPRQVAAAKAIEKAAPEITKRTSPPHIVQL